VFPRSFIYFGILHGIAVASVLARPLARRPRTALVIGSVVIAVGFAWSNPVFDARLLSWMDCYGQARDRGLSCRSRRGRLLSRYCADTGRTDAFGALAPIARAPGWLRWLGRHSLAVYMVHQPILLAACWRSGVDAPAAPIGRHSRMTCPMPGDRQARPRLSDVPIPL
jgi:uncharacterized membrane protein